MSDQQQPTPEIGRNEPCPCGSGKKYKRCCGVGAAPKVTPPKNAGGAMPGMGEGGAPGAFPGGFDPSQMDPQMMAQFAQMLQRLPKGQLQRLQGIMQKAMSGKDVTRESAEFERSLPVELQQLMMQMGPALAAMGGGGMPGAAPAMSPDAPAETPAAPAMGGEAPDMSADEARAIVEKAAAEGKISSEQAEQLLQGAAEGASAEKKSGFSKFWKGLTGKNS